MGADFCFNIYDGKRALMVAAASSSEKSQWMEDIGETVQVRGTRLMLEIWRFCCSCYDRDPINAS